MNSINQEREEKEKTEYDEGYEGGYWGWGTQVSVW
jgi:hypothetical protein